MTDPDTEADHDIELEPRRSSLALKVVAVLLALILVGALLAGWGMAFF